MEKILVEWFRYDKDGSTCCRCDDGSQTVKKTVEKLQTALPDKELELKEILLDEADIGLSNTVKINGRDLMDILSGGLKTMNNCPSCSELIGKETFCNTFTYKGKTYDAVTEEMLTEAIFKVIYEK
jgi:hypothetical protein